MARLRTPGQPRNDGDPTMVEDSRAALSGREPRDRGMGDDPIMGSGAAEGIGGKGPGLPDFQRSGETPREREAPSLRSFAAPPSPTSPSPMSGSGNSMVPPSPAPAPFAPMQGSSAEALLTPAGAGPMRRSLFGSLGGLKGGGLGVAGGPNLNDSDPISSLMALLQKKPQGGFGSF